jgi:hypothetical protein
MTMTAILTMKSFDRIKSPPSPIASFTPPIVSVVVYGIPPSLLRPVFVQTNV